MNQPFFIGLGHYKRTGKDTFAKYLIEAFRQREPELVVKHLSFAYKLKQICHELYGWAGLREPEFYETPEGEALREVILPELGKSPRQVWIEFGTKAVREQVYDRTWLHYVMKSDHHCDVAIITDVRFPNEAQAIRAADGHLIKVVRPGYGPGKNLPDRALCGFDQWNYVIGASGKLQALRDFADQYVLQFSIGIFLIHSADDHQAAQAVETVEYWPDGETDLEKYGFEAKGHGDLGLTLAQFMEEDGYLGELPPAKQVDRKIMPSALVFGNMGTTSEVVLAT